MLSTEKEMYLSTRKILTYFVLKYCPALVPTYLPRIETVECTLSRLHVTPVVHNASSLRPLPLTLGIKNLCVSDLAL